MAPKPVAAPPKAQPAKAQPAQRPPVAVAPPKTAPPAPPVQPARAPAKASTQRHGFKTHEFIVYPAHGVGQIVAIEEQEVAGFKLELFVINFIKDKMTLRVPTSKVSSVGMRKLAEPDLMKKALGTLTGRARIKRTMWSRRAQEYEAKITSGDLVAIAEVVRDLYRSDAQPEQSYSERQLYEAALDRMARELSVVQKLTETEALKVIEAQLQKGPRRGLKPETEGEAEADTERAIDEAA
ncbi:MAG: CarD family transcriptional regulator [Methylobacteriaceae bacterium]|nr:CarD family transcriptional regulator [Methylobacteriaceae bacterium]